MIKKFLALLVVVVFTLAFPSINTSGKEENKKEVEIELKYESPFSAPLQTIPPELLRTPYSEKISVLVNQKQKQKIDGQLMNMEEEIKMLAQVAKAEAGGIAEISHQAAPIWCVLNRVDRGFHDSIKQVIKVPGAFAWRSGTKVNDHFISLARDVLARWLLEKEGFENVGRVLPAEYCFFNGYNGYNHYRIDYKSEGRWDWSLPSPYES